MKSVGFVRSRGWSNRLRNGLVVLLLQTGDDTSVRWRGKGGAYTQEVFVGRWIWDRDRRDLLGRTVT